MLVPRERGGGIEVHRSPIPSLRDDAGEASAGAMLIIDPRQQNAEFGCDAGPGLFLQAPLAQHALQKGAAFDQSCPGDTGGQTVREYALEHRLPARDEAVIDPDIGSEHCAFSAFAKVLDGAKLDFDLAGFRHGRIRPVEGAIGLRCTAPAGDHTRRSERRHALGRLHWAGRNTQMAAGSPDLSRTATKSRSSSDTNSEVRAPDTVGTCASRR